MIRHLQRPGSVRRNRRDVDPVRNLFRHGRNSSRHRRLISNGVDPEEIFIDSALASHDPVKELEGKMERPLGRRSSLLFLVLALGAIGYLASEAFSLQVVSGLDFFSRAQENRFASRTVYAPRGIIRDRRGETLVQNVPSLGLVFDRERFLTSGGDVKKIVSDLSGLLSKPPTFFAELGFPQDADPSKLPPRIFISRDLTREEMVVIAPRLSSLPGIEIFESFRRAYRDPYALSHLVGFVGRVSPRDLEERPELAGEERVGKSGLELFYDTALAGASGRKIVEVDSQGRETRYRLTEEARQGEDLSLTVDGELQLTVYELITGYTGGRNGASAVAIDPRSGAVRTLVSFPGFDANRFGQGLEPKEFAAILGDRLTPLFNRAVAGEFPSGSTIKPLIAAAVLEEKIIDPHKKIYDPGYLDIPHPYRPGDVSRFLDWRAHGWVDFYDAIAYSANVYFYTVGGGYRDQKGLGIERIKQYAAKFGLGSRLGIDLPGEKSGLVPDPEWKKTAEPQDPDWRIGDTYNVSIGQGGMSVTPLQMASLTAAIANGGILWRPYILEEARDAQGKVLEKHTPQHIRTDLASKESLAQVAAGMRQTVTRGTARLLQGVPVAVAAKTGTAQNVPGKPPHAWVTAFAPADNPEIAIAVMVEHAGEGATVAVPITNEILKWYFTHRGVQNSY